MCTMVTYEHEKGRSRADFQVRTFSNAMEFPGLVGGVMNWTRKRLRLWIYGGGVHLTLRGLQVCQWRCCRTYICLLERSPRREVKCIFSCYIYTVWLIIMVHSKRPSQWKVRASEEV